MTEGSQRVAVSGLKPSAEQQQQQRRRRQQQQGYASVPPPSNTFVQKAKAPFIGLTVLVTAAVAAWQSNGAYARRQEALLSESASAMVFHICDERELKAD